MVWFLQLAVENPGGRGGLRKFSRVNGQDNMKGRAAVGIIGAQMRPRCAVMIEREIDNPSQGPAAWW